MIRIRVPATSANMGAGFDTLGIALNLYNRIEIEEIPEGLIITSAGEGGYIPTDKNNLIYRAMCRVFACVDYHPTGLRIFQNSQIPMTRGLGSSSACIIGGMLGANALSGKKLSYAEIVNLAADMEGHPDNVGPAMYGGFCVSAAYDGRTIVKSTKLEPDIRFAVMIPDYFIVTKKSRGVLPETVPFSDAVGNIKAASMMQAGLIGHDLDILRYGVRDCLHQQYRKSYIDGMDEIFERTYQLGARATYLSGSGPTILSIIDKDYNGFQNGMMQFFCENAHKWKCKLLSVDNVGAVVAQ